MSVFIFKSFLSERPCEKELFLFSTLCLISYHADFFDASMSRACHESAMSIVMKSMIRGKLILKLGEKR
jgi:hypothetical protein